jgi:hypothetical protein
MLEIEFLSRNPVLDGLSLLPGIGSYIADMRHRALYMNNLHFMEVYELRGVNGSGDTLPIVGNSTGLAEEVERVG